MNSLKEHDEFTGEQRLHSYFKSSPAVNQRPKDPSVSSFCKASQPVDESPTSFNDQSSVKGSIILPPFRLTADDAVILKATLTQSRFLLYMQNLFKSERLLICKTLVTGHSDQQEAVHFPPKGR